MTAATDDTVARFQHDIATHQVVILRDDGVYRHIRFKRPTTMCMHFDLVTWPGYLCYSGDMGCFVFSRLDAPPAATARPSPCRAARPTGHSAAPKAPSAWSR